MNWNIKDSNPKLQAELSNALGVHPAVAQLLINRNITDVEDARHFLSAELSDLHDPFLMKGMEKAVARVKEAHRGKEKILIFGDYDVDGVTSSAILHNAFKSIGIDVINHIPHRMEDGYGLNHEIAEYAKEQGVHLLVTVDCGISAKSEVESIKQLGIDVIVIDHHEPEEGSIPDAVAVIDPKQKDCPYPFKHLAAVGLAAKLIQALTGEIPKDVLNLVAIGTIADIVPLRGENRIFVKAGLPDLSRSSNKGLIALMDITKIIGKKLQPYHVGFILGPRINAAGRMDTAHTSLDLFLAQNQEEAYQLASELDRYNSERQRMQKNVVQEAVSIVEEQFDSDNQKIIVLANEGWHKGVLGIVSSKITEKYYRPSIVISVDDGVGVASCRSINGFHLYDALSACSSCLEEFGGHAGAAGLTIKEENIGKFRDMINEYTDNVLEFEKLVPTIEIDCDIGINTIDMKFADVIDSMEPYGEGNPSPIFCSRNLIVKGTPQVLRKGTLKFWVTDGEYSISAVGFGMEEFLPMVKRGEKIDIAYQISIDDWNKAPTPQLKLKDIKSSG